MNGSDDRIDSAMTTAAAVAERSGGAGRNIGREREDRDSRAGVVTFFHWAQFRLSLPRLVIVLVAWTLVGVRIGSDLVGAAGGGAGTSDGVAFTGRTFAGIVAVVLITAVILSRSLIDLREGGGD